MASGLSVYMGNKVLDKVLLEVDYTPPASYWVALFTSASAASALRANDPSTASEVSTSGTAYARIEVRGSTGIEWATAANGTTNQNLDIAFNEATGSWGTVYAIGLMDAASGGNVIAYADLDTPRAIDAPDVLRIPANQFVITA